MGVELGGGGVGGSLELGKTHFIYHILIAVIVSPINPTLKISGPYTQNVL